MNTRNPDVPLTSVKLKVDLPYGTAFVSAKPQNGTKFPSDPIVTTLANGNIAVVISLPTVKVNTVQAVSVLWTLVDACITGSEVAVNGKCLAMLLVDRSVGAPWQ